MGRDLSRLKNIDTCEVGYQPYNPHEMMMRIKSINKHVISHQNSRKCWVAGYQPLEVVDYVVDVLE